jgi:SAM-dependent methyltransferase
MTQSAYLGTTRAAYDAVADEYAALFADSLAAGPLERGLLTAFAELVRTGPPRPVADLGCGPGRLTAFLSDLGLDAFGVDLSPAMIAIARRERPDLSFDVGTMTGLGLADGTLGGIVAWFSIIHTPPADLPGFLAEFHRLLAPGGQVLVAFQTTDQPDGPPQPFDHKVTTAYRWPVASAAALLRDAGFTETAHLVRVPTETERFLRAFLLFSKPSSDEPPTAT